LDHIYRNCECQNIDKDRDENKVWPKKTHI